MSQGEVTQLLDAMGRGSKQAVDQLLPMVYSELRQLAARHLNGERVGQTLQATGLVHEVYLRLVGQRTAGWSNRIQFFAVAAQAMRRVLIDRARMKRAQKRGGNGARVELDEALAKFEEQAIDLVALDEALKRLAKVDYRKSRVVELRFFGGLPLPEVSELLDCPLRTIERDWTMAKAWLRAELVGA